MAAPPNQGEKKGERNVGKRMDGQTAEGGNSMIRKRNPKGREMEF